MRNIFDQYEQAENKLTHALISALSQDSALALSFLRDLVEIAVPPRAALTLIEQRLPGQLELSEEESERRGLPDACITDNDKFCVAIESKVESDFGGSQIDRHRRTLERAGYKNAIIVGITAHPKPRLTRGLHKHLGWKDVYSWMSKKRHTHPWADKAAEFMEIQEARMVHAGKLKKGSITQFAGIPFGDDHEYSYAEARRLIRLLMEELRNDRRLLKEIGIDPLHEGRGAITGSTEDRVWDFLSLKVARKARNFTNFPHLTLSIQDDRIGVAITIPHGVKTKIRKNLVSLGEDGFRDVIAQVVRNLERAPGWNKTMQPWFNGAQRHYLSQRSVPITDASIQFDLRTAVERPQKKSKSRVKSQPLWLSAAFESLQDKRGANYQIQVGAQIPYAGSTVVKDRQCVRFITDIWLGCWPFLDAALKGV